MPRQAPRRAAAAKAANVIKRLLEQEERWSSPKKVRVVKPVLEQLEEETKEASKAKDVGSRVIYDNGFDADAEEMLDTTGERKGSGGGSSSSSSQFSLDLFLSTGIASSEPSPLQRRNAHQKRREARQVDHTSDKRPSRRGEWRMSSPIYSPLLPCHLDLFDSNMKPHRPA